MPLPGLRSIATGTLFLALLAPPAVPVAAAQERAAPTAAPIDYETAHLERKLRAVRVVEAITIDGKLDEPAWRSGESASHFIQVLPNTGLPATEDTEVRVLYDNENVYVGAICFDRQVDRLVTQDRQRDFPLGNNDIFTVFLDTLNDNQSGFLFATNPGGAMYDLQANQDGDDQNVNWDGVWMVKAARIPAGWSVEFAIPFRTLRFSTASVAEWGINFGRLLRRRNEESQWAPLPRRFRTFRPSLSGALSGLDGSREGGRNLKVKPFGIGGMTQLWDGRAVRLDGKHDGGFDLKYGVTGSLTADLTFRTDFSQVEADTQQVNLTRFNLFFPEKREFFIENSGLFTLAGTTGNISGGGNATGNLVPFFSRRIGLSPAGTPIPVVGGGRLTGTVGKYGVGVLAMQTESSGSSPANSFLVGRVLRNLGPRSWIGALVTDRQSNRSNNYNRVVGVDANVRLFQKMEVSSYLLQSETPGRSGRNQGRLLRALWRDDLFSFGGQYDRVQANFNPEVGFVARPNAGHYAAEGAGQLRFSPTTPKIRDLIWRANIDSYSDDAGRFATRQAKLRIGADFRNGAISDALVVQTRDRLVAPFAIRPNIVIPVGEYDYRRYSLVVNSDRSRVLSANSTIETGTFWTGRSTTVSGGSDLKPNDQLAVGVTFNRTAATLPQGAFTTTLLGARVAYAFSTRMFINSFLQYNSSTKQFTSNTRFNLIHRPLSDLFIVFNDRRDTVGGQLLERAVIVKLTNLFEF